MEIGVILPSVATQQRENIDLATAARHAEDLGLDSVWHGDHLATGMPSLDCAVALAVAAAATTRIRVGASVFVPGIRPLAWAAKQIASLQHVSRNRLVLGVGSGGGEAQWAAAGVPYKERGRRTDTALRLLPALLNGDEADLPAPDHGAELPTPDHGDDHNHEVEPPDGPGRIRVSLAPAVPVPPIWVGNASTVALRRAAQYGDGWFPSMIPPADVAAGAARLTELATGFGRPTPTITIGASGALGSVPGLPTAAEIARNLVQAYGKDPAHAASLPFTGGPAQIADRLSDYEAVGAAHLVIGLAGEGWRAQCEALAEAGTALNR